MRVFRKTNVSTRVHKNGHNSTCDQYFCLKLAPLDSAHIGLSFYAKNSFFKIIPNGPFSHSRSHMTKTGLRYLTVDTLKTRIAPYARLTNMLGFLRSGHMSILES